MAEEVEEQGVYFLEQLDKLKAALREADPISDQAERDAKLVECEGSLKTLKELQKNYSREVTIAAAELISSQAKAFKKQAKDWKVALTTIEGDIGRARAGVRLYGGGAANISDGSDMNTAELRTATADVQQKTMTSVNNTRRMVAESEAVAGDTLVNMQIQGEQIDEITSHSEKINRDLTTNFGKKNKNRVKGGGKKVSRYGRLMGRGKKEEGTVKQENEVSLADVGLQEASATATNDEFLEVTEQNNQTIDSGLEDIAAGLDRLGDLAQGMNAAAKEQNAQLDNLEVKLDENQMNLEAGEKKIDKIRRGRNCTVQ